MCLYHVPLNRSYPLADARTIDIAPNESTSAKTNTISISRSYPVAFETSRNRPTDSFSNRKAY